MCKCVREGVGFSRLFRYEVLCTVAAGGDDSKLMAAASQLVWPFDVSAAAAATVAAAGVEVCCSCVCVQGVLVFTHDDGGE